MPFLPPPKSEQPACSAMDQPSTLQLALEKCDRVENADDMTKDFLNLSGDVADDGFDGEDSRCTNLALNEQLEFQLLSEQLGIAITDSGESSRLDEIYDTSQATSPSLVMAKCNQTQQRENPKDSLDATSSAAGVANTNKPRLRWTVELHERFVEALNKLDGPEKATPKGVLKLMDVEGHQRITCFSFAFAFIEGQIEFE